MPTIPWSSPPRTKLRSTSSKFHWLIVFLFVVNSLVSVTEYHRSSWFALVNFALSGNSPYRVVTELDEGSFAYTTATASPSSSPQLPVGLEKTTTRGAAGIDQKVVMISYVFGEKAANKRYLRLFVESAARSGIDVAIVGYPALPYPLPPNVRHVSVTWDELVDRVRDRIFHGKEPRNLRDLQKNHAYYKIIDFKPLFAHLFPEQVQGYDWWGHLDNDMIMGNLRHFLNRDLLDRFDIISSLPHQYTHGPFTLYRNTPVSNELFRHAERPLKQIFATDRVRNFDEWGHNGLKPTEKFKYYYSSMSGIVDRHRERLGIRWFGGIPSVWEGYCLGKEDGICSQCNLVQLPDGGQQLTQDCFGQRPCVSEVAFVHFQYSKNSIEESLVENNGSLMEKLIDNEQYRINFLEGITPLNSSIGTAAQLL